MPKYTPSFIDYGAVAKVYSDELYRQAQLNAKRNDLLDKHFDTEYKMYSGKVRKQDLAEFDSSFAGYQMAAKGYQRANKSTGHNISEASTNVLDAKNNMLGYIQESAQLGEYGKNLNKYRTEAKNLLDRDKLDKVLMDVSTMTTSQFKEAYGSIDKWPSPEQFEFKPEEVKVDQLNRAIKGATPPKIGRQLIPSLDDNGVQKTVTESINFGTNPSDTFTYNVPLVKMPNGLSSDDVYFSTRNAGLANNSWGLYYKSAHNALMSDLKSDNPAVQMAAQKRIEDITEKFPYIKSIDQITPDHVYASQFIDENNLDDIEIPDYKSVNQKLSMWAKSKGISDKAEKMAQYRKNLAEKENGSKLKVMTQVANLVYKSRVTGMLGDPNLKKNIQDALSSVGVTISDDTFKKMTESKVIDMNDVIDIITNTPKKTPAKSPINAEQ